ncbi:extracellular solute-binding protein [Evansella sp. AB-rgal1]|uniref:extracellular solute-binding protein n=1 Tax=Evansella sp. AB-rgal1 TaxID=3242696 RepID=UPI00359F05E7
MKRVNMRFFIIMVISLLLLTLIACSNSASQNQENNKSNEFNENTSDIDASNVEEERMSVRIMTTSFDPIVAGKDSPALKAIEDYTNMDIILEFVDNSNYPDRFNVTLASGDIPHIIMTGKTPSFINAARDGAFWDITDYLADYENLREANEIVLNNTSIDGRIYGLYRSRPLGRNGVTINKQWLDNLGLEIPKTMDEFYEVLRAFTYDDPNQSGADDTYGIVISSWAGPWDVMQVWLGAPNEWGFDESGELLPDFMFEEYREALRFFKKLYDEGLVNEDFAVMDPGVWFDPIVSETAGVLVDVIDQAHRLQNRMVDGYSDDDIVLDVFGAVEGPNGLQTKPTAGYNGMLAISKTAVKTEEELRRVLQFLNDLNDEYIQNIAYNGLEGIHHEVVDGELVVTDDEDLFARDVRGLNQFQMAIPEDRFLKAAQSALQDKQNLVMEQNVDIVIGNPAEPLNSDTYAERGQQLDNIIDDARIKFIVGQIDESDLDREIERWLNNGGREYIQEMNEAYQLAQGN